MLVFAPHLSGLVVASSWILRARLGEVSKGLWAYLYATDRDFLYGHYEYNKVLQTNISQASLLVCLQADMLAGRSILTVGKLPCCT